MTYRLDVKVRIANDLERPFTRDEALALARDIAGDLHIEEVVIWDGNRGTKVVANGLTRLGEKRDE